MSETNGINGLVGGGHLRTGRMPAPANAAVAEITRRIHAGELAPDPANLALIREMVAI